MTKAELEDELRELRKEVGLLHLCLDVKEQLNERLEWLLEHFCGYNPIRDCRGCDAAFVAERSDQFFCSRKCRNKLNQKKHRERHLAIATSQSKP